MNKCSVIRRNPSLDVWQLTIIVLRNKFMASIQQSKKSPTNVFMRVM